MSDYVVRRPPTPAPRTPEQVRRRKVGLITGAVALGLGSLLAGWMYLGLIWDMSTIYGNDMPYSSAPYALVPAVLVAGFARCVLSLRHRERPGLLVLLVICFTSLALVGTVLGAVGDSRHDAYVAAQTDLTNELQRDTLRALPMNQSEAGAALAEPMCDADKLCSISVWVKGGSTAESLASLTTQMQGDGWSAMEGDPGETLFAGQNYIVAVTVQQESDKGGTDFLVTIFK